MILSYRRFRRSRSRYLLYLAVFLLLVDAVNQLVQRPPTRRQHIPPNRGPNQTTVFIASVHGPPAGTSAVLSEAAARGTDGRRIVGKGHQNDVFAGEGGGPNGMKVSRHAWNDAVLRLVAYLGPENVHFSAVEAGTAGREPETQEALLELRAELDRLHASNTIRVNVTDWDVLDQELDDAERQTDPPEHRRPGWIWDREMKRMQMRRIPYMAELRNLALEPMERDDRRFDYILWLNDALFDV